MSISNFIEFRSEFYHHVTMVRDDANKVMDTMFLLLTNTDTIYKQVVFWKKPAQLEELLNMMKGPMFNKSEPQHKELLSRNVRQARLLLRVFNLTALSTCVLWVLLPTILYMQGKPVEFAIWLPFDTNKSPQFYGVIFYVWFQISIVAGCNTTMDAFMSFVLAQCRTQLAILRLNLENVVVKSKKEASETKAAYPEVLRLHFYKILLHYDEISRFANKFQSIFGGVVLYQFLVSGWIICTTAYRIVGINPASVEFISMLLYMGCMLIEIFLFCYYGNEVNHESDMLTQSAYCMDWLQIPLKYRKDLIIFMERMKRPIKPMAGVFIPLSNDTFVTILRNSYSFYAFLRNTD